MELIDKAAVVAEIEKIYNEDYKFLPSDLVESVQDFKDDLLIALDTLEVKKVEEKFECPNIKIKDAIEVSSRMKYIDEDIKPIADFIMDYASWNLHKDEWNQPVLEVPLFRVLDALVQRGRPYCCRLKGQKGK